MEFLEKNWQWLIVAVISPIIAYALNYYNNKRDNKRFLKEEEYKANKENLSNVNRLIDYSMVAFAPIKINPPKSNEEYLELVRQQYDKSKKIFDDNTFHYSENTIKITKEIYKKILNCYYLQKKIDNFKSMKMPWDNITPIIDELDDVYFEDIEKELPVLQKRLKEEIKQII